MGVIFWLFGYVSGYVAIMGVALAIAVGLYCVAELAEEYPSLTGKIIKYTGSEKRLLKMEMFMKDAV